MAKNRIRKPLDVDSIYQTESIDSPVYTYYRGKPYHRIRDVGIFDLNRMFRDHSDQLVRSSQEYMLSASDLKRTLFWTIAVFDMGNGVFWHATVKTNSYNNGNAFEGTSSILNLTDGFIGDLVQVHLICTVNSELESVDHALLRPGRQKFFRKFERLNHE